MGNLDSFYEYDSRFGLCFNSIIWKKKGKEEKRNEKFFSEGRLFAWIFPVLRYYYFKQNKCAKQIQKKKKNEVITMDSKSKWPIIIVVIVIIVIAVSAMGKCGCSSSDDPDNWGAGIDWGDNYYWDSSDHSVKEKTKCVAEGTLITLADGTQKPIEQLNNTDLILAFDHETGEYVSVNPIAVYSHGYALYPIVDLAFSDGNQLCVISGHVFFDLDLMKYVEITPDNYADFIGHRFVKYSGKNAIDSTVLTSARAYEGYREAWGTWGISSLACVTNGILSLPNADGTYNYFTYDENLKYDEEAMAADIQQYGLYTYEEWSDLIPCEVFDGFNFKYFKVAIGKGLATRETYLNHIELFYELAEK